MTCVNCLEETKFSFPSESHSICANMLLSVYTPPPCKQILWKASMCMFFCPRNLDIIKCTKLTAFSVLLVPPRKCLSAAAVTLPNIICFVSINFDKYYLNS